MKKWVLLLITGLLVSSPLTVQAQSIACIAALAGATNASEALSDALAAGEGDFEALLAEVEIAANAVLAACSSEDLDGLDQEFDVADLIGAFEKQIAAVHDGNGEDGDGEDGDGEDGDGEEGEEELLEALFLCLDEIAALDGDLSAEFFGIVDSIDDLGPRQLLQVRGLLARLEEQDPDKAAEVLALLDELGGIAGLLDALDEGPGSVDGGPDDGPDGGPNVGPGLRRLLAFADEFDPAALADLLEILADLDEETLKNLDGVAAVFLEGGEIDIAALIDLGGLSLLEQLDPDQLVTLLALFEELGGDVPGEDDGNIDEDGDNIDEDDGDIDEDGDEIDARFARLIHFFRGLNNADAEELAELLTALQDQENFDRERIAELLNRARRLADVLGDVDRETLADLRDFLDELEAIAGIFEEVDFVQLEALLFELGGVLAEVQILNEDLGLELEAILDALFDETGLDQLERARRLATRIGEVDGGAARRLLAILEQIEPALGVIEQLSEDFFEDEDHEAIEGILEGIDLENRQLVIDGQRYPVDADLEIEGLEGNLVRIPQLVELVGSLPFVEAELNAAGAIVFLLIAEVLDGVGGGEPDCVEFFGLVSQFENREIVFAGPRFRVTARTHYVGPNGQDVSRFEPPFGRVVAVTPGAPDPTSDSPDPIAVRVQVVNPLRPPPARTDLISGRLVSFDGANSEDPHVGLAGPSALVDAETVFTDENGAPLALADLGAGFFVEVLARPPAFGEEHFVAKEVIIYLNDLDGESPNQGDEVVGDEIRVDGFVADVDEDRRYLGLEGKKVMVDADEDILVFDVDGNLADLDDLFEGDLVEIDTRFSDGDLIATAVRVLDPSVQILERPGVIAGTFAEIDDDYLCLVGRFFFVPRDAELTDSDGRLVLGDIHEGDYVRVVAVPPRLRRGEQLPAAIKIRVTEPPVDEDFDGKVRIVSTFPKNGDVGIPIRTFVEFTFNTPIFDFVFEDGFDLRLRPQAKISDPQISPDGRTIFAEVSLERNQIYQASINTRATGLKTIQFSTGQAIPSATIHGLLTLDEELPANAEFVPDESFALLVRQAPDGTTEFVDDDEFDARVVAATQLDGRQFAFERILPGDYFIVAFAGFEVGNDRFVELRAVSDGFSVGREDVEVELVLSLPEALHVVNLSPQPGSTGLDLTTEIVVQFNKPAILELEHLPIFPFPEDIVDFGSNDDLTVWTLTVELAENTVYRAMVANAEDLDGGELVKPESTVFTTAPDFSQFLEPISGRLVLPYLPARHAFAGPVLVALVPVDRVERDDFDFFSFDEEDIAAATITNIPEFIIDNVPPGRFFMVAFVEVKVPAGFRPGDPRVRALENFDIARSRFDELGVKTNTIELFGILRDEDGKPQPVTAGDDGLLLYMEGEGVTRDRILRLVGVNVDGQDLTRPASRDALPVVNSGEVEIRVTFDKPLAVGRGFVAIETALNGRFIRQSGLADGNRTVIYSVDLAANAIHRLAIFDAEGAAGSLLSEPLDVLFSTGGAEVEYGAIRGQVRLLTLDTAGNALSGDQADRIDRAKVVLFEVADNGELILEGTAEVKKDGTYILNNIVPGTYRVFAEVQTASGQEQKAVHNDRITVGEGETIENIDILATVVVDVGSEEAPSNTVPPGGNASAVLGLDLNPAAGNQRLTAKSDVEVGDEITVDLHITGGTNVSGFAATLRYNANVLDFIEATDLNDSKLNFLRLNNGLALFLPALVSEVEVSSGQKANEEAEYGGAILSATESTAGQGAGFLARYHFRVKEDFNGAQITLNRATLNSLIGQDVLTPGKSVKLTPPPPVENETRGPVSIDFNAEADQQDVFHKGFVAPKDKVEFDVYLNLDLIDPTFVDLANYSVTIEFDPTQLSYVSYAAKTAAEPNYLVSGGGIVPVLSPIITELDSATRAIEFGAAGLGLTAAQAPDQPGGLIARLSFVAAAGFTGTDLLITKLSYKALGGTQQSLDVTRSHKVATGEVPRGPRPPADSRDPVIVERLTKADADGNGLIDFTDFFSFSESFGKTKEQSADQTAFDSADLNGDGIIDFNDFFLLAEIFGQAVAGKQIVRSQPAQVAGALALAARSTAEELVLEVHAEALPLRGYGAVIDYDPQAFRLLGVEDDHSVLRAKGEALLLTQDKPGQVLVAGSAVGRPRSVDGLLAELRFEPLQPEASGLFRVRQATVRQRAGVVRPEQLGSVDARWVPQVFALLPNYPNPFNPSTTIRYQLPTAASVRLDVYDVLGQKIRTLVSGQQAAGVHRAVWDSRNQTGQLVAAGTYFYRLEAGEFTQVRKLMLVK